MLKIEVDGKSYLNPNEELRNQIRDIVKEYDEKFENNQLLDENTIYAVIYDITTQLKEINPVEYISIVTLVYQDVFTYFKYMKKNNEFISYNKQNLVLLEANNMEEAPKLMIYVILFMSIVLIISLLISSSSNLKKNPKELLIDTK